jgi:hypothetical protein
MVLIVPDQFRGLVRGLRSNRPDEADVFIDLVGDPLVTDAELPEGRLAIERRLGEIGQRFPIPHCRHRVVCRLFLDRLPDPPTVEYADTLEFVHHRRDNLDDEGRRGDCLPT